MNETVKTIQGRLHIVTALACELKPLIDEFRLGRMTDVKAFAVYANADKNIYAIVAGIGKVASAAATAFLHAYTGNPARAAYLNLGIAGAAAQPLGQLYQAHKISDAATRTNYYPALLNDPAIPTAGVTTFDKPQSTYPENELVDMEASAFFATARRLVDQESIQVLKIISDNTQSPSANVTPERVKQWVQAQLPVITAHCHRLLELSAIGDKQNRQAAELMAQVRRQWRVTAYQQNQLQELLRRWCVSKPGQPLPAKECDNTNRFIEQLTAALENHAYHW
jgi:adenosylhomocysteine nucleosidase